MIVRETNTGVLYDAVDVPNGMMKLYRMNPDKDYKKLSCEEVNDNFVFYDVAKPDSEDDEVALLKQQLAEADERNALLELDKKYYERLAQSRLLQLNGLHDMYQVKADEASANHNYGLKRVQMLHRKLDKLGMKQEDETIECYSQGV